MELYDSQCSGYVRTISEEKRILGKDWWRNLGENAPTEGRREVLNVSLEQVQLPEKATPFPITTQEDRFSERFSSESQLMLRYPNKWQERPGMKVKHR